MAYLELSLEAYDNLIKAAGNRGAQVSRVCREQGCWEAAAADENPAIETAVDTETEPVQTDLDLPHGPVPDPVLE